VSLRTVEKQTVCHCVLNSAVFYFEREGNTTFFRNVGKFLTDGRPTVSTKQFSFRVSAFLFGSQFESLSEHRLH